MSIDSRIRALEDRTPPRRVVVVRSDAEEAEARAAGHVVVRRYTPALNGDAE